MRSVHGALPERTRRLFSISAQVMRALDPVFSPDAVLPLEKALGVPIHRTGEVRVRTAPSAGASASWTIGQRIRAARLARGWTQQDLSDRSAMARPNISRLEAGRHAVRVETVKIVAQALSLPLADLFKAPVYAPAAEDDAWLKAGVPEWSAALDREDPA